MSNVDVDSVTWEFPENNQATANHKISYNPLITQRTVRTMVYKA